MKSPFSKYIRAVRSEMGRGKKGSQATDGLDEAINWTDEGAAPDELSAKSLVNDSEFILPTSPVATDPASGEFRGFIDTIEPTVIKGWVWDRAVPGCRVRVSLYVNDVFISEATADQSRQDLASHGIGDGGHGFEFVSEVGHSFSILDKITVSPIGHAVELPRTERLENRWGSITGLNVTGLSEFGGETLPKEIIKRGNYQASIVYSRNSLKGWIKDDRTNEPVSIKILVDGRSIWEGIARRLVVDAEGGSKAIPAGFWVQFDEPETAKTSRVIDILGIDGQRLLGGPFNVPFGDQYIGQVEKIEARPEQLLASGWCFDISRPSESVCLELLYNGEVVSSAYAHGPLAELKALGFDPPNVAFTIEGPPIDEATDVQIRPKRTSVLLARPLDVIWSPPDPISEARASNYGDNIRLPADEDEILGWVDEVSVHFIRGWARNMTDPDAIPVLDCFIDGALFASVTTHRFRADLKAIFGDHGYHEYLIELPPTITQFKAGRFNIQPRFGSGEIKHKVDVLPGEQQRKNRIDTTWTPAGNIISSDAVTSVNDHPKISLIVVNRNGLWLMDSLLVSIYNLNTYDNFEIIIVDNGSAQSEITKIRSWQNKMPITVVERGGNFSFSDSNNMGARVASGDILVFLNNDIRFTSDILPGVIGHMQRQDVGCLGIRLTDEPVLPASSGLAATQHLGIHFGSGRRGQSLDPFETRLTPLLQGIKDRVFDVPAVTGAFMVCRKSQFIELAGFDERYFYGWEDTDLCLKYRKAGYRVVCANDLSAGHLRAVSRNAMDQGVAQARMRNRDVFVEKWGLPLRRLFSRERFERVGFWTAQPIRVAFAVTEASPTTTAGDYFTAMELADELSRQFPCECSFLEVVKGTQYDAAGFDVLIAMRDDYDPGKIQNASPHLIKIAWIRNWFERFSERPNTASFNAVWASAKSGCEFISKKIGRPVLYMPIATNPGRFAMGVADEALASDYCFTGSYWGANREIVQFLDPEGLPFRLAIFGQDWEKVPRLAPFSRGALPYSRMADVYASTKIVVDDANHVTKTWGSVNSRVFDAIAAGALVLSNSQSGSADVFNGLLPTFSSPQELEDLLWHYLEDNVARQSKVRDLQEIVLKNHTYAMRAELAWSQISDLSRCQIRFSIKIGAPNKGVQHEWGDYHFAMSLKYYLEQIGHFVRVDCIDEWYGPGASSDDVVLVLRGLTQYRPNPTHLNLQWIISHPDKVSADELQRFDHVFVASEAFLNRIRPNLGEKGSVLLQATDGRSFNPDVPEPSHRSPVLFVGNSRLVRRPIVLDSITAGLPLEVYGTRWAGIIPDKFVVGENVPNAELGSRYRFADVVLNDHWHDMREAGFISNRLFDAVASGAFVVSDQIEGLAEVFGDAVHTYSTAQDLAALYASRLKERGEGQARRDRRAKELLKSHSFENRARTIADMAASLLDQRAFNPDREQRTKVSGS